VAGSFYPARSGVLDQELHRLIPGPGTRVAASAVLVPHAGYLYSGRVAGRTFSAVQLPRLFLLLGPNHSGRGESIAVMDRGEWEMPAGRVPVHRELAGRIIETCPLARPDEQAHRREHCLEVQLPFLQFLVPELQFVPVCLKSLPVDPLVAFGEGIGRVLSDFPEPVLIVISSDMTHYESQAAAETKDRHAIDRLLEVDPEGLWKVARERGITMCGLGAAVAGLAACRYLGCISGKLVDYSTSGPVSGDFDQVVGYAGVVIH
jgi:AmmeMemoRadiSam system protein B